jgi:tRNA(Ile)-lysidine synthase
MICKVKQTIDKYNLLDDVKSLAVGVSGGADSMCLLEILSKLKVEYDIIIKAVHLNHNIRGDEALRDQKAVEAFCKKLGIECLIYSVDIPSLAKEMGIGEEECGRIKRYECFSDVGCDAVATAHTLSDSIETMMFNLIRGTGVKGLCGIPPKRDNIIRPLIECSRNEIENYCKENHISYVTDSTNLSDDYTRNYIRHNIIPAFGKINESFESAIAGTLETLKNENAFIESSKNSLIENSKSDGDFKTSEFINAHSAVRRRALAEILSLYMIKDIEKRHIDLLDEAVIDGKGKIEISKDLYIVVSNGIISAQGVEAQSSKWICQEQNGVFNTPYGKYIIEPASAGYIYKNTVDADKILSQLIMSSRENGDRFYDKKRGQSKTLKKLFNEKKIPPAIRNSIAILRDGENIVWIDGFGTDGKYLPDINTKNVLIIKKEG